MIKIIVFAITIAIIIFELFAIIYYDWKQEKRYRDVISSIRSICISKILNENKSNQQSGWSASEYYAKIEEEIFKIAQEKEMKNKYSLILWWGLDGLKMRDDGTFEWISKINKTREESKSIEFEKATFQSQISFGFNKLDYRNIYYQPQQSIVQHPETEYLAKLLEQQNQNRINELNDKMKLLKIQAAQHEQNQRLMNQIRYTCVEGTYRDINGNLMM